MRCCRLTPLPDQAGDQRAGLGATCIDIQGQESSVRALQKIGLLTFKHVEVLGEKGPTPSLLT
jgi:hypothetical protein